MTDYQKHTTHTDALDTLGMIIGPDQKRDAIHLAVFPVEAGERLRPGDDVYLDNGVALFAGTNIGPAVGIVDPFLVAAVNPRQMFWLVVYPRQITSLRHVWEHDSFPPSGETQEPVNVKEVEDNVLKRVSESWLRSWVSNANTYDQFETFIERAVKNRGWITVSSDGYGEIPTEFWHHLSVYTGKYFDPDDNPSSFSCSC